MKNNTVKVAIIGCGRVSGHHCRSIAQTEGAELIAVCDLISEKANAYREQFGAKAYENYHQMLIENPQIDTVAIITPSGMHYEHALDIISRYQKNIIVEKPTFMKPSQVKEALARKPSSALKVDDIVDDSLVVELEKEGFINRIYRQ